MTLLYLGLLAYLCGSVPFGKIAGRRYGVDIQKRGSGNIGFANVYRVLGPRPAYMVLVGDVAKGLLPALLAARLVSPDGALVVGSLAIIGHVFPVWLKFRGGKGVATAFGVSLALYPPVAAASLAVYIVTRLVTNQSAVASLLAAASLPLLSFYLAPAALGWYCLLPLLAIWTHRDNIRQNIRDIRPKKAVPDNS